ncbi:hypothetical protein [Dictyobacter kobayashii]|uniref:DUF4386 domain-containing protein n=1 Tax=Dictyobacter kobayashii TaxID=2014872 RepID=A0A402AJ14_9CHLR|nr:hypothetical protein [Dictyobacter kobayashii]GCE19053.1 hypothetical protein KDK_28530 [Dictyobacter kobayashii]
MKKQPELLARLTFKIPRVAAVAGIVFSLLLAISIILIGVARPTQGNEWIAPPIWAIGLNLIPFAGIAFLWFIGVLRERIGIYENRIFATVFLGSGLLFLAMLFVAAAVAASFELLPKSSSSTAIINYSENITYNIMDIYAMKMAAIFMTSTSSILLRTAILSRWLSYIGYACALGLLVLNTSWEWMLLLFPFWVFLLSLELLVTKLPPSINNSRA